MENIRDFQIFDELSNLLTERNRLFYAYFISQEENKKNFISAAVENDIKFHDLLLITAKQELSEQEYQNLYKIFGNYLTYEVYPGNRIYRDGDIPTEFYDYYFQQMSLFYHYRSHCPELVGEFFSNEKYR